MLYLKKIFLMTLKNKNIELDFQIFMLYCTYNLRITSRILSLGQRLLYLNSLEG